MVDLATQLAFEQAEEEEDITSGDAIFHEVGLFSANLAEPAIAVREHRVIMT